MDDNSREHGREHSQADQKLRLAALETAHVKPLEDRLDDAATLLMQLRGLAAGKEPIPAALDQEIFAFLHAHAEAKKQKETP